MVACYTNVWADGWYLGRIEGESRAAEGKGSFLCEAEAVGSEVSSERSVCNRSPRPARNRGWLILFHLSRHVAFHSGIQANDIAHLGDGSTMQTIAPLSASRRRSQDTFLRRKCFYQELKYSPISSRDCDLEASLVFFFPRLHFSLPISQTPIPQQASPFPYSSNLVFFCFLPIPIALFPPSTASIPIPITTIASNSTPTTAIQPASVVNIPRLGMKLRPLAGWPVVRAGEIVEGESGAKAVDDGDGLSLEGRVVNCAAVSRISRIRRRDTIEYRR